MKVKNNLHILMGKHKIRSIHRLSKETGITRQTLTRIYDDETERLDLKTIATLCKFFDVGVGELLYLDEEDEED